MSYSNEQRRKHQCLPREANGNGIGLQSTPHRVQSRHNPHRAGQGGSSPVTTSDFVCDKLYAGARRWSLDVEALVGIYSDVKIFIVS